MVEFPDSWVAPGGFATLLDLADRGVIDVLDVEFVAKAGDGSVARVPIAELHEQSGILTEEEFQAKKAEILNG